MSENSEISDQVTIYTDGSSLGNPGPGGWGALLDWNGARKSLSKGYRLTTNNRMEIRGVLHALEQLTRPCRVTVVTDSQYVCDTVEKKWLQNWVRNGWVTSGKKPVKNRDLWEQLLPLLKKHTVRFRWVRGHAGHPENEECDRLAKQSAKQGNLLTDDGYEGSAG